jgi:hypothetical protein
VIVVPTHASKAARTVNASEPSHARTLNTSGGRSFVGAPQPLPLDIFTLRKKRNARGKRRRAAGKRATRGKIYV